MESGVFDERTAHMHIEETFRPCSGTQKHVSVNREVVVKCHEMYISCEVKLAQIL